MFRFLNAVKNFMFEDAKNEDEVLIPMKGRDIYLYV